MGGLTAIPAALRVRKFERRGPSVECLRDQDVAHITVPPADSEPTRPADEPPLKQPTRPRNWLRLVALAAGGLHDSLSMTLTPAAAADPVRSGSRRIHHEFPTAGRSLARDRARQSITITPGASRTCRTSSSLIIRVTRTPAVAAVCR